MRLLVTFEVTWRALGQLLLLLVRVAAGVAVVWVVAGPVAAVVAGALAALVISAFFRLGRD